MRPRTSDWEPPSVRHGVLEGREYDSIQQAAQDEEYEEMVARMREIACGRYLAFNHLFLGLDIPPIMLDVQEQMEGHAKNMLLTGRGQGKSENYMKGPQIHDICYSVVPGSGYEGQEYLYVNESGPSATETMSDIQEAFEEPDYEGGYIRAAFGDIESKAKKWNESTIHISGSDIGCKVVVSSYGGATTGMHPDRMRLDDVVTRDKSRTDHQRTVQWKTWTSKYAGMVIPGTKVDIVGTRYDPSDLYGMMKQNIPDINVIDIPAMTRYPNINDFDVIRDEDGDPVDVNFTPRADDLESVWPCPAGKDECLLASPDPDKQEEHIEKYGYHRSAKELVLKWLEDPIDFGLHHMVDATVKQGKRIKPHMLRFYSTDPEDIGQLPVRWVDFEALDMDDDDNWSEAEYRIKSLPMPDSDDVETVGHAWDHAIGKRKTNDDTAFSRGVRDSNNDIYFINDTGKWDFEEAITKMEYWFDSEPYGTPISIATEAVGFQKAYSDMLLSKSRQVLSDVVEPVKRAGRDKDEFLNESGILTAMLQGKVYVDYNDSETINQLLAFSPGGGSYKDDIVDAMAMCYVILKESMHKPMTSFKLKAGKRGREGRFSDRRRSMY